MLSDRDATVGDGNDAGGGEPTIQLLRQIGTLLALAACPLRSESGQAHACLDMSASCRSRHNAVQQISTGLARHFEVFG